MIKIMTQIFSYILLSPDSLNLISVIERETQIWRIFQSPRYIKGTFFMAHNFVINLFLFIGSLNPYYFSYYYR